jgi:hypothetical protein
MLPKSTLLKSNRSSEDRREQLRAFRTLAVLVVIGGIGLWLFVGWMSHGTAQQETVPRVKSGSASSGSHADMPEPQPAPTPPQIDPHEQRLADLRKKEEAADLKIAIEREVVKRLGQDVLKFSMTPFGDPDERQYLMERMDKEEQRIQQLMEEKKEIDAEIAQE